MIDGLAQQYRKLIRDKIARLEHDLGRGNASDFADYRKKSGIIVGYEDALKTFQETIRKLEDAE